jgi:lambda family phage portal protein
LIYYGSKTGYGTAGASTTRRATKGMTARSSSPHQDIDMNQFTLRQRGRLMYMGNPVAASAIKTLRTNTIGVGLTLNPRPDTDFLGLSTEQASEWVKTVKREFGLWADRPGTCDATGINNFYDLQQMLVSSWLQSGDVFVFIEQREPELFAPYRMRLKTVEADRIVTPNDSAFGAYVSLTSGKNPNNGNTIYDGIEIDKNGMVAAYWVCNKYPYEISGGERKTIRIEARGEKTGLPNVLHILATERPEQYRGVSFLAPVIIPLLQLNRYTEAEIDAAVVEASFAAFVKTTEDPSDMPFNETMPDEENPEGVSYDPNEYEIGPGTINVMNPGEDITFADPKRPASGYEAFVGAIATQIGAALEIPKDILLKQFNASYSASRGALLEAWKSFRMYRTWFINDFCNPVYELWMTEAVASGRIKAPGFFTDPSIRSAWLRAQWIGPSQGQLDPTKEIKAEVEACANGFSTHADSALRINGSDFDANVDQLIREQVKINDLIKEARNAEVQES